VDGSLRALDSCDAAEQPEGQAVESESDRQGRDEARRPASAFSGTGRTLDVPVVYARCSAVTRSPVAQSDESSVRAADSPTWTTAKAPEGSYPKAYATFTELVAISTEGQVAYTRMVTTSTQGQVAAIEMVACWATIRTATLKSS
jgi:hypothetical protein